MKYLCLLAVLFTLPVTATAQQQRRGDDRRSGDRSSSERGAADRDSNARGSRDRGERDREADHGKPPAKPSPLVPSWEQKQVPWWERQSTPWWEQGRSPATPNTRNPQNDQRDHRDNRGRHYNNGGVLYVVPSYPYIQETQTTVVAPPPPTPVITRVEQPPPPAIGFLNLEVEPRDLLQIYVDGVFVGTPADLGNELRLAPGVRKIELRARGYKAMTFDAEIVANRSISYSATLERDETTPAPPPSKPDERRPAATSGPMTMYMIQGCYLGNIAPKEAELRPGCDISKLVTFRP